MEDVNNTASNVAAAIAAAFAWDSTPEIRQAAVVYLDYVKAGDIRLLASTSFVLVKKGWSSAARLHAFKILQHLVRFRWEELSPAEHRDFANLAVNLMSEMADPYELWALKSQTAALVAEILRREGLHIWQELLPSLVSLSNKGPIEAELVSMMLRWLPEDITANNEDLEGHRHRQLLRGLTQSLPDIFPLLYTLLERHFGAALSEVGDIAKQHAATVTAILNAINAYAEWAPLPDLAKHGIIHGCSYLLSSPDFRLHGCKFFKLISPRKRPVGAPASEFDSAMRDVFQILMNVSRQCLLRFMNENDLTFAEYICESMVLLGSSNLQCIASDDTILSNYLQQMLGYFSHLKLALHFQSLSFWLALMRGLMSKPKAVVHSAGDGSAVNNTTDTGSERVRNEKRKVLTIVNDDICREILDISFQRIIRREKVFVGTAVTQGTFELWSDDFEDKGDFGQYRARLLELVKFVAGHKPLIAGLKVSDRIVSIINNLSASQMCAQDLAVMESMHSALENVASAVFDGPSEVGGATSEVHSSLCIIFKDLLQQLLSLKWTAPASVEAIGHYLIAMGPFLKHFPDAVGSAVYKLFELLNSLPFAVKNPATSSARHARLQICISFIKIAKITEKSILPHMEGIAETMAYLQGEGRLRRHEHNLLGEAVLIMASSARIQQQHKVLAWLLKPLSKQWMQLEWQNTYLSEPLGLVHLCSDMAFMWSPFYTVAFFEKAIKRSGTRKGSSSLQNSSAESSTYSHPMASHLSWMLPPLLKLLQALHFLWSPSIAQALPEEMKAAMILSNDEQFILLGEGNPKSSKGALTSIDGSQFCTSKKGYPEPNELDIRNWLKGIRDSGYNVLGLSTTLGDPFFKSMDSHYVAVALMENIQSMEFRHIRQLIHSVLMHLVKSCPPDMWETWLDKLLRPLFIHCQRALSYSWSSLMHEDKAKVPDIHGIVADSDLKVEVMEEKLLRDLTREICSLLSAMASSGLNTGLPALEQSGHFSHVDMSSLKDLDSFAPSSMVGFLLKHKDLALPALQISLAAFTWADGEAVTKVSSFCAALVLLAISTNNAELREFVAKDLFSAIIQGLALESNAFISADLVGLCREIYIHLCDRDPAPRQILLSLPCITQQDMIAFEDSLTKRSSPKEQKQLMKSLLLVGTGNKLKALAA